HAREQLSLLVGIAVDDVVDLGVTEAACVQQDDGLGRGAVPRHPLARRDELSYERADRRANLVRRMRELGEPRVIADTPLLLALEHHGDVRGRESSVRTRQDTERATVDRQMLDVDHVEPTGREKRLERREREVTEMLVVDRVELEPVD